ncbi:MAG: V-type ATP synthase subunit F [Phycisphaerae bacterium]
MMENKIAVLGNSDFVMPFSALGLDTFAVGDSVQQVQETAEKIVENKYSLIVVAENTIKAAEQVFVPFQKKSLPAIVVVPFTAESQGLATESLAEALKMATGVNILDNN